MKVSDRDEAISRLRQQSTDTVSQLEKTHMTELLAIKEERDQLQQQINEFRLISLAHYFRVDSVDSQARVTGGSECEVI